MQKRLQRDLSSGIDAAVVRPRRRIFQRRKGIHIVLPSLPSFFCLLFLAFFLRQVGLNRHALLCCFLRIFFELLRNILCRCLTGSLCSRLRFSSLACISSPFLAFFGLRRSVRGTLGLSVVCVFVVLAGRLSLSLQLCSFLPQCLLGGPAKQLRIFGRSRFRPIR